MTPSPGSGPVSAVPVGSLWRTEGRRSELPPSLLARWREGLKEWGAPPATAAALERLVDPRTRVVVTGQQPGAWGGPLYNLYKGATATALAERATAAGAPAVAVFWVQGDDADWGEVGWGALPRPDLSLFTHRWEAPIPSRHWVGSAHLAAPEEAEEVFRAWGREGALLGRPRRGRPDELGSGFIATLLGWFGEAGLVPLDARWGEVHAAGFGLWRTYLERHREIAAAVVAAGERLAAAGRPALLDAASAEHGLFVIEGERRLDVPPEAWEGEVGRRLDAGAASPVAPGSTRSPRLAPTVLLRAVLQDHLFGTAAHVVGGAESAYLDQLAPVYDALGVVPPVRVPRLRALVAPGGLLPEAEIQRAADDPEGWMSEAARRRLDAGALAGVQSARRAAARALETLASSEGDGRKDLSEVAESARRKIDRELARVEEVLERRARQDLYREEPRLRHLAEFLRPRRGEQERGLSAAAAYLLLGERAPARVLGAARAHLERLVAGAWDRFTLEGDRD